MALENKCRWSEKRAGKRTVVCLESFARKRDLKELWLRTTSRYLETQKLNNSMEEKCPENIFF